MYVVISILILIVCILLSLVVLVQNPKGGGLNQSLGGVSNQVFGAKRSTNLVEKATWYMAIAVMVLSLGSAAFISGGNADEIQKSQGETLMEEGMINVVPSGTIDLNDVQTLPESAE